MTEQKSNFLPPAKFIASLSVTGMLKGLSNFTAEVMQTYMRAEEEMVISFCKNNGIQLPEATLTDVKLRQALMRQLEVIISTRDDVPLHDGESVVQEAWCADRRGGKQGFDKTYPRVQLVKKGANLTVRTLYENQ